MIFLGECSIWSNLRWWWWGLEAGSGNRDRIVGWNWMPEWLIPEPRLGDREEYLRSNGRCIRKCAATTAWNSAWFSTSYAASGGIYAEIQTLWDSIGTVFSFQLMILDGESNKNVIFCFLITECLCYVVGFL